MSEAANSDRWRELAELLGLPPDEHPEPVAAKSVPKETMVHDLQEEDEPPQLPREQLRDEPRFEKPQREHEMETITIPDDEMEIETPEDYTPHPSVQVEIRELDPDAEPASPAAGAEEDDRPKRGRRRGRRGRRGASAEKPGGNEAPSESSTDSDVEEATELIEESAAEESPKAPEVKEDREPRRGARRGRGRKRRDDDDRPRRDARAEEKPAEDEDDDEVVSDVQPRETDEDDDIGEEDRLTDWDVPLWNDLIASLYRPSR